MLNPNHAGSSRRSFSRNAPSRNHRGRMLFSPHQHHTQRNNGSGGVNGGGGGGASGNINMNSNPWYNKDVMDPWNTLG